MLKVLYVGHTYISHLQVSSNTSEVSRQKILKNIIHGFMNFGKERSNAGMENAWYSFKHNIQRVRNYFTPLFVGWNRTNIYFLLILFSCKQFWNLLLLKKYKPFQEYSCSFVSDEERCKVISLETIVMFFFSVKYLFIEVLRSYHWIISNNNSSKFNLLSNLSERIWEFYMH